MKFLLLTLLALGAHAGEEAVESEGAWVLAYKQPTSNYGVEDKEYIITYKLVNVGDKPATKVTLDDRNSYSSQFFQVLHGNLAVRIPKIAPKATVSHSVVLRPTTVGVFNFTPAIVSYLPDPSQKEVRHVLTNLQEQGFVYRRSEYERRFASKWTRFFWFAVIISPVNVYCFLLYSKLTTQYAVKKDSLE